MQLGTHELLRLCLSRVFRCTLTSIPQTQSLLGKAKMPLGLLLHPFKDLSVTPRFSLMFTRVRSLMLT